MKNQNEKSLKEICQELNIPWTDNPEDIKRMIENKMAEAEYKDKLRRDL